MASVRFLTSFFLYLCITLVKSDDCVTYSFENDVSNYFFNDTGICEGLGSSMSAWNFGRYSDISVDSFHQDSDSFISASSTLSCGSTFQFSMTAGGTVEVNIYTDGNSVMDQISVLAMQSADGSDLVLGNSFVSPSTADYVKGWQTIRMTLLGGSGTFQGYISLMGVGSADSLVLVDSFRYIPPSVEADSCLIYTDSTERTTTLGTETTVETTPVYTTEANVETTKLNTEATATPESEATSIEGQETTTQQTDAVEKCVTYNFESDFDVLFSTDNYLCNGFDSWELENYTSIDIESPDSNSKVFMTPLDVPSCISSFIFKMEPGGEVEATVYMEPTQDLDHIIIIAQRVTDREYDTVAGFVKYHPGNPIFTPGWSVIRFSLLDLTSFDGYLIFIGSADKSSTVFVDSVRYIPPQTPPEDASCIVY